MKLSKARMREAKYVRTKIGQILLILAAILFVIGGVGFVVGFLPQGVILPMGALAIIFVGAGASMRKRQK